MYADMKLRDAVNCFYVLLGYAAVGIGAYFLFQMFNWLFTNVRVTVG